MKRRTTIELDEELLARARLVLGQKTTRATIEEALRRAAQDGESDRTRRAARQQQFFGRLPGRVDTDVLASGEMWR